MVDAFLNIILRFQWFMQTFAKKSLKATREEATQVPSTFGPAFPLSTIRTFAQRSPALLLDTLRKNQGKKTGSNCSDQRDSSTPEMKKLRIIRFARQNDASKEQLGFFASHSGSALNPNVKSSRGCLSGIDLAVAARKDNGMNQAIVLG